MEGLPEELWHNIAMMGATVYTVLVRTCKKMFIQGMKAVFSKTTIVDGITYVNLPNGWLHNEVGPAITRKCGTQEWYIDGLNHRDDGPAIINHDRSEEWYQWGDLHREDGPAVTDAEGNLEWYFEGLRHRVNGPAVIREEREEWWVTGELHRVGGPALLTNHGEEWHLNGFYHRIGGPAFINDFLPSEWWRWGRRIAPDSDDKAPARKAVPNWFEGAAHESFK